MPQAQRKAELQALYAFMSSIFLKLCERMGLSARALQAHAPVVVPFLTGAGAGLSVLYACFWLNGLLSFGKPVFWAITGLLSLFVLSGAANVTFARRENRAMQPAERAWFAAMSGAVPALLIVVIALAMSAGAVVLRLLAKGDPTVTAQPLQPFLLWCLLALVVLSPAMGGLGWLAVSKPVQAWFAECFPPKPKRN
ncbi:hypothetical protein E5P1_00196 (plasmid) [Variovorax sp. PBL-E5]|nr:hypothetical protein SRS16P1_00198 [Variovorax sp. SRS16]VTU42160.1 hypothetical protein E5P1_00196 [Variovorax sp. PBL-E5]